MGMTTVIDISHYNSVTDWSKLKKDNPFIIFKGTQGTGKISSTMKTYINACENHKIPYWIYCYLEKGNEEAQAKFLVDTVKKNTSKKKYFVGLALDAEENNDPNDILLALEVVKAFSTKAILYTMYSQYKTVREAVIRRGPDVAWWEARYGNDDGTYNKKYKPHSDVDLHQFTSNAIVNYISFGMEGVDMSRLTGKLPVEWFTTKAGQSNESVSAVYDGGFPKFPPRGYFKYGDGYRQYVGYAEDVKDVQAMVDWLCDDVSLTVDGKYGKKTEAAVKVLQSILGVTVDGYFGQETLSAALKYEKKGL